MKHAVLIIILAFCSMAMTCNKPQSGTGALMDLNPINVEAAEATLETDCKKAINYAPSEEFPEHTPLRYVKVNFTVINSEDGSLTIDEETSQKLLKLIIDSSNVRLDDNFPMKLPKGNETPVLSPQFRYVLSPDARTNGDDGVYYHYNDDMCYFNSDRKSKDENHGMFSRKQYEKYGVQPENVLNIFVVEHHPDSLANRNKAKPRGQKKYQKVQGVGHRHWVKLTGIGPMYKEFLAMEKKGKGDKPAIERVADYYSKLLNHEIGHSLGLAHTWATNDGCDDTPQHNNCWYYQKGNPNCTWDKLSNNVMDYNAWMKAYTPCQLGKVHYNFAKEKSSQRKLLRKDWCVRQPSKTITIPSGAKVVWDDAKDLMGDIVIEKNASLQIECVVSLPKEAKIIVKDKGQLTLGNNAHITNRCGGDWGGIEYWAASEAEAVKIENGAKVSRVAKLNANQ